MVAALVLRIAAALVLATMRRGARGMAAGLEVTAEAERVARARRVTAQLPSALRRAAEVSERVGTAGTERNIGHAETLSSLLKGTQFSAITDEETIQPVFHREVANSADRPIWRPTRPWRRLPQRRHAARAARSTRHGIDHRLACTRETLRYRSVERRKQSHSRSRRGDATGGGGQDGPDSRGSSRRDAHHLEAIRSVVRRTANERWRHVHRRCRSRCEGHVVTRRRHPRPYIAMARRPTFGDGHVTPASARRDPAMGHHAAWSLRRRSRPFPA